MWVEDLPAVDEELRQGDLLVDLPFPRTTTVRLTAEGFMAEVDLGAVAIVLDHCCTVEQKHVVLLGRVKSQGLNERMLAGLRNVDPQLGTYSRYMHLLESHLAVPTKTGKHKVINLLDRVQLFGQNSEDLHWLREKRVARMRVVERAHLRQKLAVLFGRVEEEGDLPALRAEGLDTFGRPQPGPARIFGPQ